MIDVKDKSSCCGCSACSNICPKQCIVLKTDTEGFVYPHVDTGKCIACGLCEKVCPMLENAAPAVPLQVYAAVNNDDLVRRSSSSGGVFSLLAAQVIGMGGVVFGACFDDRWRVVHSYSEDEAGLAGFRGSKYLQSEIGVSYASVRRFLRQGRQVLFSGTPCQIAGLRLFLGKEYDNLLTVDVVCHGVPSPLLWEHYLESVKEKSSASGISSVAFRDKSTGWKQYSFSVEFADAPPFRQFHGQNVFFKCFLSDVCLRPSCYNCPSKGGRSRSDITLGDYWGIQNHHPEIDDNQGVTLVMLNSEKGRNAFSGIGCRKLESTYDKALQGNPSIERSSRKPYGRDRVFKAVMSDGLDDFHKLMRRTRRYNSLKKKWHKLLRLLRSTRVVKAATLSSSK